MKNRHGNHTVTRLTAHLVWITKYRYHVHVHIEYPPSKSISDLVKRLKGRSLRLLQKELPELGRKYWGNICGELVMECRKHYRRFEKIHLKYNIKELKLFRLCKIFQTESLDMVLKLELVPLVRKTFP